MSEGPRGAILQRDKETYAIVPRTPVGMLSADILETMAKVIRKYDIPVAKITSGQRIALVGIKEADIEPIWEDLKLDVGEALELCLHYVQACPGTAVCKFGIQDSLGMGMKLEALFQGIELPAKFKMGISGCHFCCAESYLRDFGAVGTKKGWTVIAGGHSGRSPRIGDVITKDVSSEELEAIAKKFIAFYKDNGKKKERVSKFIDRVGLDAVKEAVL